VVAELLAHDVVFNCGRDGRGVSGVEAADQGS
jgi:hypothetical protein